MQNRGSVRGDDLPYQFCPRKRMRILSAKSMPASIKPSIFIRNLFNFKNLSVDSAKPDGGTDIIMTARRAVRPNATSLKWCVQEGERNYKVAFQKDFFSNTMRMVSAISLTATGFINKALMPMAAAFSCDIFLL